MPVDLRVPPGSSLFLYLSKQLLWPIVLASTSLRWKAGKRNPETLFSLSFRRFFSEVLVGFNQTNVSVANTLTMFGWRWLRKTIEDVGEKGHGNRRKKWSSNYFESKKNQNRKGSVGNCLILNIIYKINGHAFLLCSTCQDWWPLDQIYTVGSELTMVHAPFI